MDYLREHKTDGCWVPQRELHWEQMMVGQWEKMMVVLWEQMKVGQWEQMKVGQWEQMTVDQMVLVSRGGIIWMSPNSFLKLRSGYCFHCCLVRRESRRLG